MEHLSKTRLLKLSKAFTLMFGMLFWTVLSTAAQNVVKGTVKDTAGDLLPGVSVQVSGVPGEGAITDLNGTFSVKASGRDELVFSYVGMKQQRIKVNGRKVINVTMEDEASTLNDIVVVGYGSAKKQSLTGAVSAMRGDELLKGPSTNVSSLLGCRVFLPCRPPVSRAMTRQAYVSVVRSMLRFILWMVCRAPSAMLTLTISRASPC